MSTKISEMFFEGNMIFMSILTLFLALLFLAAWKAPAWVRSIGSIALAAGVLFSILGINQIFGYMQQAGSVAQSVLYGGYKTTLIPYVLRSWHLHRGSHHPHLPDAKDLGTSDKPCNKPLQTMRCKGLFFFSGSGDYSFSHVL